MKKNTKKTFGGTHEEDQELDQGSFGVLSPPPLTIRLLGSLEVRKGAERIDDQLFGRQKVKILLALLVVNQGKEISREKISETLWPESYGGAAHRNLYSLWSLLKRALKVEDGSCPYLVKTQYSYRLDKNFVTSDVSQLDALVSELIFEDPPVQKCIRLYRALKDVYRGDFLPSEEHNDMVLQAREQCRIRLVEACSVTARRLYENSHYDQALWFAREALDHDPSREEIYSLLMQIQIILGQRTGALKTYFECRKYLTEELGIDPSKSTSLLYEKIIDSNFELA